MSIEPLRASDAEASLLGACLAGFPDLDDLTVEPGDFYSPTNGEIWAAILRVHHSGNRPDVVSVRLALGETKVDPLRLFELSQLAPVIAQAPYYAEQVVTAAGLRAIAEAGTRLQQLGGSHGDLDHAREEARQVVDTACRGRSLSKARTLADILPGVIDRAEHGATSVLNTGWSDIDRIIGGWGPGRLVVVGARPGVGKSVLATNAALHMAHAHGHAALVASMEMDEAEVGQRLLAAHARVNLTALQDGLHDEAAWQRIAEHHAEIEALPITIDDTPSQTVTHIRRAARNVQRTRDDLALIVVDYLQLVRPADSRAGANRAEQVGQISRDLKILARETGACVVALAQVNRAGAQTQDGKPRLTDLRESGSIEADADQVLLMNRPDFEVPEVEVEVAKNRHGPQGVATLLMQGHYARLANSAWTPTRGVKP